MHQLDPIETPIEKQKQIALANVASELRLDDGMQAVKALAHIDVLGIEIDLRLSPGEGKRRPWHGSLRSYRAPMTTSWNASADSADEPWSQCANLRITSKQSAGTNTSTVVPRRNRTNAVFAATAEKTS